MAGPARQIPLDLEHRVQLTRDDLVVSPANAAAASLIDRWPDWAAPVAVIVGPPGSGKTHLSEIWRHQAQAVALSAANLFVPDDLPPRPALLIDDVDAAPIAEAALFHLINIVRAEQGSLLMTARRRPAAWQVALPDLASRLRAAAVVEVAEPDDALLEGVITKLFADRQLSVEPSLVTYLVRRMERSLDAAMRLVDRLDRAALEEKTRITRAFAASILRDPDEG